MAKTNVARIQSEESTATAPTGETPKKKVGRKGKIPTMPVCVIYQDGAEGKNIVAQLTHPDSGNKVTARGRGLNGTLGELGDAGYPVSNVTVEGPEWVKAHIPLGVTVLGYATPTGFPVSNIDL